MSLSDTEVRRRTTTLWPARAPQTAAAAPAGGSLISARNRTGNTTLPLLPGRRHAIAHQYSVNLPPLPVIVVQGVVLHTPVVDHHDQARGPSDAAAEPVLDHVPRQRLDQPR